MLRECKRQNKTYQRHIFPVLGQYAAARTDADLSDTVFDIVTPVVDSLVSSKDDMDVDGAEKIKDVDRDDLLIGAVTAAGKAFGPVTLGRKGTFPAIFEPTNKITLRNRPLSTFPGLPRPRTHL